MRLLERPLSPATAMTASPVRYEAAFIPKDEPVAAQVLWRTVPSFAYTAAEHERLRGLLGDVAILGEARWREAAAGDAAKAVGIAMEICDPDDGPSPMFDLAMSALFACVIDGDPAAGLVFAHIVRRADWLDHVEVEPVDLHHLMAEGVLGLGLS